MQHQPVLWRQIQRYNFVDWKKLAVFLELSPEQCERILKKSKFVLNLPLRLAQKISKGNLEDPILKQFLPIMEENLVTEGYKKDPVNDQSFRKELQLLQKYEGRALLICTSACAMHCRYCFRQNFAYDRQKPNFSRELELIREDLTFQEIILSGGDPLSLDNLILKNLLDQLNEISHVKRIRFHTRFPIGIPERIDEEFLAILKTSRAQILFVIHANHFLELDEDIFASLKKLQCLGIPVLNQCVLLKGVNDTFEIQKKLCECLVNHGILPYYMHQLDPIQGFAHFEVEEAKGIQLIQSLNASLSGYAVPRYVKEIPGSLSKTPVAHVVE